MARLSGAGTSGVEPAIDTVQMGEAADRPIGGYSKGMRQRIQVAAALAPDPDVLVLDEPLNGTDPVQRGRLIELFEHLGKQGKTVIVSSHVLEEVERVSTRVVAIVDGKLAAAGSVQAIRAAMRNIPYVVRIGTDRPRRLGASLFSDGIVDSVEVGDDHLLIRTRDVAGLGGRIASATATLDARLTAFLPQDESLESVFRYLVERR
jgi:ABC-2 type transport system ATP-binding protein